MKPEGEAKPVLSSQKYLSKQANCSPSSEAKQWTEPWSEPQLSSMVFAPATSASRGTWRNSDSQAASST